MRCELTWQGVTMTAYRSRCRRLIAGLGISGNGFLSSLYSTPQAHDTAPGDLERVGRFGTKHGGRNLNDEVAAMERGLLPAVQKLLPTPLADDTGHRKSKYQQGGTPLSMAANLLNRAGYVPTPTAGDAKDSGSRNTENSAAHYGLSLTDAVRGDGGVGRLATDTGPLNPPWIEWLMGFPIGWTDCEPSETP